MKKIFFSLLVGAIALTGCDFFVDPVAYNDQIVDMHTSAIDVYNDYITLSDSTPLEGDLDALDQARVQAIADVEKIRDDIKALEGLKDDTDLRDGFAADLDDMIGVLSTEDKQLVELWKRMAEVEGDIPQEMIDEESAIFDEINTISDAAYEKLDAIQEAFADKHGYELEPSTYTP